MVQSSSWIQSVQLAGTCLSEYDQMTGVVRGVVGATGTTVAVLAVAFLLASTTAAGADINQ